MKIVRGVSGIALMPVFHPGVVCREEHKLTGSSSFEGVSILLFHAPARAFRVLITRYSFDDVDKGPPVYETRLQRTSSAPRAQQFILSFQNVKRIFAKKGPAWMACRAFFCD